MEPTKVYVSISVGERRLILDGDAELLPFLRATLDSKIRELSKDGGPKERSPKRQGDGVRAK